VMKSRRSTRYSRCHRYDLIERAATGLVCGTIIASQSAVADRSDAGPAWRQPPPNQDSALVASIAGDPVRLPGLAAVVGEGLFGLRGGVRDSPMENRSRMVLPLMGRGLQGRGHGRVRSSIGVPKGVPQRAKRSHPLRLVFCSYAFPIYCYGRVCGFEPRSSTEP
jgi:hypothetical protein